jgi:photosystem II stability/assembly factor-like uncharacterized protein
MRILPILASAAFASASAVAQAPARPAAATTTPATSSSADTTKLASLVGSLRFRSIGPALTSGRIADVAVDPTNKKIWYVATAAGGVWKSVNAGLTFAPIFDGEGSYSTGAIAIDPKNPNVIWVGSGENNAQRVVAYGDGVYKSIDGGRSWKNVGLKESEHIGRILIDPRNSDVVYVASQGPVWSKGGERGVYKTTDGGTSWTRVLHVDDWTGANDVQMDPRNPDVLIATTWQRQRRTCCFVAGGPGSGVHRSTDGGKTWVKSQAGFPAGDLGRIGLAMSPADPNVVYAIAEAAQGRGGFFRSTNGGVSWERMSGYQTGGNYYNEIFADPVNVDRVYAVDVILQVTDDGGRNFRRVGEQKKHVDNHSVWIDPDDTEHLIVGNDGGVYETHDRGRNWRFVANLPVTQFYRVTVDDVQPFYRVAGGTQDNFSMIGPSRTRTVNGIRNSDWIITQGGDGFGSAMDPSDPNTVYAQAQFGVLSRFNLATGDAMGIQPEDAVDGPGLRWNWDSPLMVSPHSPTRLYFAAERLLRSDDRGNSWRIISPDLSRNIDRTKLKMMDRVQSVDAVARNQSTTLFGNITTIAESPLQEGLLITGTNDGRISVTEDGGTTWRSIDRFATVPETTYVTRVTASSHDARTIYATFNNHWTGDYKPYVLKSTDLGRTWTNITANLPARGSAWAIAEDPRNRQLLFVGTDFGVFTTVDGGGRWVPLKGGLPTIQVRDIAIQPRHNDLVIATFGRGFYVLDDYSPLRTLTPDVIASTAHLFPARPALLYSQSAPLGLPGASFQGAGHYMAENPPFGATLTYYLKDELKSRRARRRAADDSLAKKNVDATMPSWADLKAEDREEEPAVLVEISDGAGNRVRRLTGPTTSGMHRVTWDLHYQPTDPVNGPPFTPDPDFPFGGAPVGPFVLPGQYTARLYSRIDGAIAPLGAPMTFAVVDADPPGLRRNQRTAAVLATELRNAELERSALGVAAYLNDLDGRLRFLRRAIDESARADSALVSRVRSLQTKLLDVQERLNGDPTRGRRNESSPTGLLGRLQIALGQSRGSTLEAPTPAQQAQLDIVRAALSGILAEVRQLADVDVRAVETAAEAAGIPWTAGRLPQLPPG